MKPIILLPVQIVKGYYLLNYRRRVCWHLYSPAIGVLKEFLTRAEALQYCREKGWVQ